MRLRAALATIMMILAASAICCGLALSTISGSIPTRRVLPTSVSLPPSTPRSLDLLGLPPSDGLSTSTKDWACVRFHESTDGKLSPNIYQLYDGFIPGSSRARQNAQALALWWSDLRDFGDPWTAWAADSKVCGLGDDAYARRAKAAS